jgi:hypothetical protein
VIDLSSGARPSRWAAVYRMLYGQAAVALCQDHSVLQVSRGLRLNYSDLKHRVRETEKISAPEPGRCPDFVEVDFGSSTLPSGCTVEMETPNGAKMKMYFKVGRGFDPLALSKAFWRQGL